MLRNSSFATGRLRRGPALAVLAVAALFATVLIAAYLFDPPLAYAQGEGDPPGAPVNVSSGAGVGLLDLTWTAPPGSDVTGYDVEYKLSTAADQAATTAGDPSTGWVDAGHTGVAASHALTGLTHFDTWYDVRVRAANEFGSSSWAVPAVWESVLTVQRAGDNANGCHVGTTERDCSHHLTANRFTYNGVSYQVQQLAVFPAESNVQMVLINSVIPLLPSTILHVGDDSFVLANASVGTYWKANDTVSWSTTQSWSVGDKVRLRLTDKYHTWPTKPVSFGTATVADLEYTVGTYTPPLEVTDRSQWERLPEATGGSYLIYTATGLPAGLTLGRRDRVVYGTPEAVTDEPVEVTYTATDEDTGSSASLTFNVTVNPAPTIDTEEIRNFTGQNLSYTVGQTSPLSFTFPAASGGTGTLTYYLDNREPRVPISDYVTGVAFDPYTRVLSVGAGDELPSGDPQQEQCTSVGVADGVPQRCAYRLRYWVEDERGARAAAFGALEVSEAPSLTEIADQSFTVGDDVSITLPRSPQGSIILTTNHLDYRLSPDLEGLSLEQEGLTITGTASYTGSSQMTYTVTDLNGVSASRTFTIAVASGPDAPASAPALTVSVEYKQGNATAHLDWGDLADATGYVIQVRAADDSFPSQAVAYLTGRSGKYEYQTRTVDGVRTAYFSLGGVDEGSYTARVAGKNDDGAGPWSAEVSFTVTKPVGGL